MKALAVAVSLLLMSPLLPAQSAAQVDTGQAPDQSVMTLKQEVRNVVVDVVVTDKHGNPMKSLDKARFQVMENGVAQDVKFFEEHSVDENANPAASQQPKPNLPPDVYTNVETVPSRGALSVLLLDAMNTPLADQSYVRAQMFDYLKQIPPGTHMAIFTLGDKLQLIQGFTTDPAILKAALNRSAYPATTALDGLYGGGSGGGTVTQSSALSGATGAIGNPEGLRLGGVPIGFGSSVAMTRASLDRFANGPQSFSDELRTRYTIDALNAMAIYLDGIPGRKNLIWFAGSIPWTINPDFSLVTSVTGRVDYSEDLKKLADVMTLGRISIYPIDARGLVTPPGFAADSPGLGARASSGGGFGTQEMGAQMDLAGNHMSMSNLAAATGGQALYNTNGLAGAVVKVQSIGENFYTLAYSPKDKRYDGGFRQLDIKVDVPGVKLEYRRGYYAEDPAKASGRSLLVHSNPLRAVMQRGAPDATQIPFRVQVKVARRQPDPARPSDRVGNQAATLKGPLVRYDFHWTVDLNGVEFTPGGNGAQHGEVDATLTAYDADGKILNNVYSVLPLNLSAADYNRFLKSGLPMKQSLDLPAGTVFLRAGVLDPSDGHTGATEFPLTVQPAQASVAQAAAVTAR